MATITVSVVRGREDIPPGRWRASDAHECHCVGMSVEEAATESARQSNRSFAVYFNGELACVWGVQRVGHAANLWLLTTEEVERHPLTFVREGKRLADVLLSEFRVLRAEVHADYLRSREWMRRMGFEELGEGATDGFLLMERTRDGRA